MAEMTLALARTVFLPKGSPGICTVRDIKADIHRSELVSEGGKIFCSGEADLLIEYLSFAPGEQYPGYEEYEQPLSDGASMWQALLTMPFELVADGDLPCPPLAELSVCGLNWYMVAPHALEMEMELKLVCREEDSAAPLEAEIPMPQIHITHEQAEGSWHKVSLRQEAEQAEAMPPKLSLFARAVGEIGQEREEEDRTTVKVTLGGARLDMEKEVKVINLGVSDQGWRLTDLEECEQKTAVVMSEETVTEKVAAEKVVIEEMAAEKVVIEEVAAEKVVIEEVAAEKVVIEEAAAEKVVAGETVCEAPPSRPVVMMKPVETPYQPQPIPQPELAEGMLSAMVAEAVPVASPGTRRRVAGMPQLKVCRPRCAPATDYRVNFQLDEKK